MPALCSDIRIHKFPVTAESLLFTFQPYHAEPVYTRLVQIVARPSIFSFLSQYADVRTAATLPPVPRQLFTRAISRNSVFLETYFNFVIARVKTGHGYTAMTVMWSTMTIEAILQMRQARVGEETIVSRIMPFIAQGLQMKRDTEFQVATYMVLTILASNRTLTDKVMNAAMDSICQGWTDESRRCGIMCLATLAEVREGHDVLADSVVKALLSTEYAPVLNVLIVRDLAGVLESLPEKTPCDKFLAQLAQKLLKSSQLDSHSALLTDIVFSARLSIANRHAVIQSATIECSKFGLTSPSETAVGNWLAYCATEHNDDFKDAITPILNTFGDKQIHNLQSVTRMNLKVSRDMPY